MKKKCILWKEKYDKIKFTILLLLVGINVGFANEVYSQSTLLSLHVNKGTVKDVFAAIEGKVNMCSFTMIMFWTLIAK